MSSELNILDQNLDESPVNPLYAEISKDEYSAFLGEGASYYLEKWEKFDKGQASFNRYAFFLGFVWMIYRKMYIPSLFVFAALILEGFIQQFIYEYFEITAKVQITTDRISILVLGVLVAITANYVYLWDTQRKIKAIRNKYQDQEDYFNALIKKGGTSYRVLLVILLLVSIIVVYMENS